MMKSKRAEWMRGSYGVMSHWLYQPVDGRLEGGTPQQCAEEWNSRVDHFDVNALADQLEQAGAKWFILTIGQNSGFYCAPNPVYDQLTEAPVSKCSRRDLFRDLALALRAKGIRTIAYLPSGAPEGDFDACLKLNWKNGYLFDKNGNRIVTPDGLRARRPNHRLAEFQQKWEQVITYWAKQWGELCSGWWIDGAYFADQMYNYETAPNFHSFAAALRVGNPDCAVCFNGGIMREDAPRIQTEEEDYTPGEGNSYLFTPFGRKKITDDLRDAYVDQAQFHMLNFLGTNWGQGEAPRYPDDLTLAWTNYVLQNQAAVTWDVPTSREGKIPESFITTLSKLKK